MNVAKRILWTLATGAAMDRDPDARTLAQNATRPERVVHASMRVLFDTRTELWEFASAFFAVGMGLWLVLYPLVPYSALHAYAASALNFTATYGVSPIAAAGISVLTFGLAGAMALMVSKLDPFRMIANALLASVWTSAWYAVGMLGDYRHPAVPIFFLSALLSWHTALRLYLAWNRAKQLALFGKEGAKGTVGGDAADALSESR